jgi:hypothetical protein
MEKFTEFTVAVHAAESKNYFFVWLETDHDYIPEEEIDEEMVTDITEDVAVRYADFYSRKGREISYEEFFMLVAGVTIHEKPLLFTKGWCKSALDAVKEQYSKITSK